MLAQHSLKKVISILLILVPLWVLITACGSSSDPGASPPLVTAPQLTTTAGIAQSGLVRLAQPMQSSYAGDIRVDVTTTGQLPDSITIQGAEFTRLSEIFTPGVTSYGSNLESVLKKLDPIQEIYSKVADGSEVEVVSLVPQERVGLIYQSNPTNVATVDMAIVLATLQSDPKTAANIANRTNQLLNVPGFVSAASLNPVPTEDNTDFVNKGTGKLNTFDVAVILAVIQVGTDRTAIANRMNQLLSAPGLVVASDIITVPGQGIPGQSPSPSPSPSPTPTPTPSPSPTANNFNLQIEFIDSSFNSTQQAIILDAAARWAQVITADLPNAVVNLSAGACGSDFPPTALVNRAVDDVLIQVTGARLLGGTSGPGGTAAQAGPCGSPRSGSGIFPYGRMGVDPADLASLTSNGGLLPVVTHEFGHVLGIGITWDSLITGDINTDPRYTGTQGVSQYASYSGIGNVPVQLTSLGHWREDRLGREVMTPSLTIGVSNPLSRITIGALADLNFGGTQIGQADSYSLPPGGVQIPGGDDDEVVIELQDDIVPGPIISGSNSF